MIDPIVWMKELEERLIARFGGRLRFLGLQGSYRRREATESSDIDVVAVLDALSITDLNIYREVIRTMPEADKACGFLCGLSELENWPQHELFGLVRDTEPQHGDLTALLPSSAPGGQAAEDALRIEASALYHSLVHTWIYGGEDEVHECVRAAYKSLYFLLQPAHYLRTGRYVTRKADLLDALEGEERRMLGISLHWPDYADEVSRDPAPHCDRLLRWCSAQIEEPGIFVDFTQSSPDFHWNGPPAGAEEPDGIVEPAFHWHGGPLEPPAGESGEPDVDEVIEPGFAWNPDEEDPPEPPVMDVSAPEKQEEYSRDLDDNERRALEILRKYNFDFTKEQGFLVREQYRDEVIALLQEELAHPAPGSSEYLRVLCGILFCLGNRDDAKLIKQAKYDVNMDVGAMIDLDWIDSLTGKENGFTRTRAELVKDFVDYYTVYFGL